MFRLRRIPAINWRTLGSRIFSSKIRSGGRSFDKDDMPPSFINLLPQSKYGGEHFVTLLTGESTVGKQGDSYISTLFGTAKVPVSFERIPVESETKPVNEFLQSVFRNRCALLVDLAHDPADKAKISALNTQLDLYACVINLNTYPGYRCRFPDLDIMLIIQNNNGDYSKLEYDPVPGMVETLRIALASTNRRYLEFVFEHAAKNCRKKITFGHKDVYLPLSDGQFIDIAREVSAKYPDIETEFIEIDHLVLKVIMQPQNFDVICTHDRFGTFLASISSAVCGGASLFSATELGDTHAVFKPLQTKLSITDCRSLSPYGIVRSCIDLLNYLGNTECAELMWVELLHTMIDNDLRTEEFGGNVTGEFVICNLVNNLKCKFA